VSLATLTPAQPLHERFIPAERARSFSGIRPDWMLVLVLLLPLLLAATGPAGLFFDGPGWIDASVYVGYFLHYSQHLPMFDGYYKISRLPWILPGYLAYHAFGPLVGNYVLQLTILIVSLAALYLTLRQLLDGRSAFVACALLGFYPWFHGNGGWSYHMTITTCYYLLTHLCLVRCTRSAQSFGWALGMGAAFACALHTHLFMAVLAPGLALCHVLLSQGQTWKRRFATWSIAGLGGVAVTLAFCCINRFSGGEFLFFMRQINYTLWLASHGNHWHRPVVSWLPIATWLCLPAATIVACMLTWIVLWRTRGARQPVRIIAGLQVQFLLALAAGCYYEFVKLQTVLDAGFMAAYLIGPMILALGAFFCVMESGLARMKPALLAAVAVLLLIAPLLLAPTAGDWLWKTLWAAVPITQTWGSLSLTGVALVGIISLWVLRRFPVGIVAALAFIGLANGLDLRMHQTTRERLRLSRDCFDFEIEADAFTAAIDPSLHDVKYWFDRKETVATASGPLRLEQVFDSFVATRCWLGNLFGGYQNPTPEEVSLKQLGAFHRIAILSAADDHAGYCGRMERRFGQLGKSLIREASQRFRHGELDVSMTVYGIEAESTPIWTTK
jgi:hypothetical protein